MTEEEIREFGELDRIVSELANGVYIGPDNGTPNYDIRAVAEYCEERGISPSSLTDEELAQFVRESPETGSKAA